MISLPIYRTTAAFWFYPERDTYDELHGEPVFVVRNTPIALVRVGTHDRQKWLVQAGDLFAWIWTEWITA